MSTRDESGDLGCDAENGLPRLDQPKTNQAALVPTGALPVKLIVTLPVAGTDPASTGETISLARRHHMVTSAGGVTTLGIGEQCRPRCHRPAHGRCPPGTCKWQTRCAARFSSASVLLVARAADKQRGRITRRGRIQLWSDACVW